MPGFFESLKRMAQGKPVFDSNDANNGWSDKDGNARGTGQSTSGQQEEVVSQQGHSSLEQEKHSSIVKGRPGTFPVVIVKRTRTHVNGTNQAIYCSIVNHFSEPVEVDEIELAGGSQHLGGVLRPGEEREYLCYNGPRSTGESHNIAMLSYKVEETGDYFRSVYDVEFEYGSDKLYSVEELHWRQPIQDIYG